MFKFDEHKRNERYDVMSWNMTPKPWKTIVGFAFLGLATAGLAYGYAAFYDYTKPMNVLKAGLFVVSVILCPAQLLFAFCIDCEVIGWNGFIMYSIIAVLNVALYTVIGALLVSRRRKQLAA
jgi:hypothetical protein